MKKRYENKIVLLGDGASVNRNDLASWFAEHHHEFVKDRGGESDPMILSQHFADELIDYLWKRREKDNA